MVEVETVSGPGDYIFVICFSAFKNHISLIMGVPYKHLIPNSHVAYNHLTNTLILDNQVAQVVYPRL